MNTATPAIRDFARRLVALEAARDEQPGAGGCQAARVCEKLRLPLSKLVGVVGFQSLMSRAVAMAAGEVPSLAAVRVLADGSLQGLDGLGNPGDAEAGNRAGLVVVAQLLGLLMTFIGEPLTLRLVRDAWPSAPLTDSDAGSGEGP